MIEEDSVAGKSGTPKINRFRHVLLITVVAAVPIVLSAGLGLRFIFLDIALREAEKDALRVSSALRDGELRQFIQWSPDQSEGLSIRQEDFSELDRRMRSFLASFDIVKIKVFNTNMQIIYSTDLKIIGKFDKDNARLAAALNGTPNSKYEKKGKVMDLADEDRFDVELVETYVPVRGSDNKIIGSFEIYKDVTSDLAMSQKTLIWATAVLLVVVLGVLAVLVATARLAGTPEDADAVRKDA